MNFDALKKKIDDDLCVYFPSPDCPGTLIDNTHTLLVTVELLELAVLGLQEGCHCDIPNGFYSKKKGCHVCPCCDALSKIDTKWAKQ